MTGPWREPADESIDLYPGLVIRDDRVSGSITLGQSRLPIWCFRPDWPTWDDYGSEYQEPGSPHYGVSKGHLAGFVVNLFELRGEFARLLLVLADAERCDRGRGIRQVTWWETKRHRQRVGEQLRRCLAALGQERTT